MTDSVPRPLAAILDASVYDKGEFRVQRVTRLAELLAKRGVQLFIPQQIVFEWAAHAKPGIVTLKNAYKAALGAGLVKPRLLPSTDALEIAKKIARVCSNIPNVTVLSMSGDAAVAGIRDQILGTGPGSLESKVRTGASDSSWVRDALAQVEGPQQIVFVTCNGRDVLATTQAIGHPDSEVRIWNGNRDSFDQHFPYPEPHPQPRIDAHTAQRSIAGYLLAEYAASVAADDRSGPPPEWISVVDVGVGSDDRATRRDIEDLLEPEATMEPLAQLIDVSGVTVEADGEDTLVYYTLRLLADVRVEGRVFDNDGNALIEAITMYDRVLRVPFTAVLKDDQLLGIEQIGPAENFPGDVRFADTYDAFQWLLYEELADWQFITVSERRNDGGLRLTGPEGQSEVAELLGHISEDWELSFDETGASIKAAYDPDSRVWLGRHDSFDIYPPVGLSSEAARDKRSSVGPYRALAAVWEHMILGPPADDDDPEGR
ncbi:MULTISPECIES: hypothetical protein [Mycolicibacterium]|uniref:hypothetical protein n=1 Tax=Mycolicibacterium TaxID=1866885 RepID=UPI0007E9E2B5|nr:hypothetical protein [Mycolicibacterium fortuitum]MDG5768377.1 hypothetical protein [Mycolicibacterium fortuitum]MDG5781167.1 hypothetical protein [Mycolicibacterium fortuitum]OBB30517.1 hypothetical protein A5763_13490 [Mycolicibacterium fortuitum]OBB51458.1 hypothetical protein A5754_24030 [Mycolicibacterium fortuitum]OBB62487.1 hypothetical protein A5755_03140 [Mycolicibacterium fortuitum]